MHGTACLWRSVPGRLVVFAVAYGVVTGCTQDEPLRPLSDAGVRLAAVLVGDRTGGGSPQLTRWRTR